MATEIYYFKRHLLNYITSQLYWALGVPDNFKEKFNDTNYVKVHEQSHYPTSNIKSYLDNLHEKFSGIRNPLCDPKCMIVENNNTHANMGVGDVIRYNGIYYVMLGCGFRKVE